MSHRNIDVFLFNCKTVALQFSRNGRLAFHFKKNGRILEKLDFETFLLGFFCILSGQCVSDVRIGLYFLVRFEYVACFFLLKLCTIHTNFIFLTAFLIISGLVYSYIAHFSFFSIVFFQKRKMILCTQVNRFYRGCGQIL